MLTSLFKCTAFTGWFPFPNKLLELALEPFFILSDYEVTLIVLYWAGIELRFPWIVPFSFISFSLIR